jgi:competence protein ComEA
VTGATLERPARRSLGVGAAIVLVLAAAATSVVVGIVRTSATSDAVGSRSPSAAAPAPASVYVHVFGAVVRPGLYRLDDGARVVDVIASAGGLAPDADESAVNLARRVSDGEQLRVPVVGEALATGGAAPGVASDGRVNLNTADVSALDTLPRVGPAIAERIIQWREDNGPFTSVDDLLRAGHRRQDAGITARSGDGVTSSTVAREPTPPPPSHSLRRLRRRDARMVPVAASAWLAAALATLFPESAGATALACWGGVVLLVAGARRRWQRARTWCALGAVILAAAAAVGTHVALAAAGAR